MPAIPQVVRDRLASSVVGTPGVDTSGQKAFESIAQGANQVGDVAADFAINRQQNLDRAEVNSKMVDLKQGIINLAEDTRRQYQNDPDKGVEVFQQGVKDLRGNMAQSLSNPRSALMFGSQDNSYFEGAQMNEQAKWAYQQKTVNNYKGATNQAFQLGTQAAQIGADPNMNLQEKWGKFTDLHNPLGQTIASMKGVQSDETIQKFSQATQQDMATGLVHGLMDTAPWDAKTILQHPDIKAALGLRWNKIDNDADSAIKGFQKKQELNGLFNNVAESNALMKFAANGKDDAGQPFNYSTIDKLRQANGNRPIYDYLEKHVLAPESSSEKAQDVMQFYTEANRIGASYGQVPAETSLHDLVKFQDSLTESWAKGTINENTFRQMSQRLVTPLSEAVLKAHDVEKYQQAQSHSGFMGMFASKEAPEDKIAKYNGGYTVINDWMKSQGKADDWQIKSHAISKYMDLKDSTQADARDYYGRPWTPETLARKAMGIGDGDTIQTPLGPKTITGWNPDTKKPKVDFSKEEQDRLNHLIQLRSLKVT